MTRRSGRRTPEAEEEKEEAEKEEAEWSLEEPGRRNHLMRWPLLTLMKASVHFQR